MGWCGGTEIFDRVTAQILKLEVEDKYKQRILRTLIDSLNNQDWDNHGESCFYDHPLVREITPEWSDM